MHKIPPDSPDEQKDRETKSENVKDIEENSYLKETLHRNKERSALKFEGAKKIKMPEEDGSENYENASEDEESILV